MREARLQELIPDAVLVGGTAAAVHARHQVSHDDYYVVRDLRGRFDELPSAAICDLLERGDLEDWKRLASAVAAEPRGALAGRVVRLIDAYPMYGASPRRSRSSISCGSSQTSRRRLLLLRGIGGKRSRC